MWFSNRDNKNYKNKLLSALESKHFEELSNKLNDIFELYFVENDLFICESCDGYFFAKLSVEDLRNLSKYFSKVANLYEKLEKTK